MFEHKIFTYDNLLLGLSIFSGLLVGSIITGICIYYHLVIFGVNIDVFIAPVVAGFVETFVSMYLRKKSSGAISAIILFFLTNGIGWLFPSQPLTFNIFTVGGFLLMLQAAFPLLINYLIIGIFLAFTYLLGLGGSFIGSKFKNQNDSQLTFSDIEDTAQLKLPILNSKPNVPIAKYHGLICVEDVIEFEEKNRKEQIKYIGSNVENKNILKLNDYAMSRKYILHLLEEQALKLNANAIIEVEFEYTNYNQQIPPDIIIAAYGTAVTIDEQYLD
ncbi:heavy metal-binding domain-containing protein [Methanosphaera sp. ISO3-F5]|uniref:heavy metal-binding domain-containing protein n=1 Tax=Methanosphaera sp. ISO3-F5 TaxID=1452353 RepID=UPI002B25A09B|nr:heavy metal-binding domain-containing protein [Methanosphaera sp. ISO3-F5]WQH65150.1 heavy metal-binding domain-containing protein [Methanosphaera sp. ISO3-F5]